MQILTLSQGKNTIPATATGMTTTMITATGMIIATVMITLMDTPIVTGKISTTTESARRCLVSSASLRELATHTQECS